MAEDALARAKAIAAKLSGGISTDLGKRKNRFEDESAGPSAPGLGAIRRHKIYIPVKDHPGVNFLGLLIGPRGSTQKQMQEVSGAKILIRGRGAQKDGVAPTHPDDEDELHVSIEGTDEAIEKATQEVQQILFNPEQAMQLKSSQLQSLAEINGTPAPIVSDDDYQIELRIPNNMVGLVIGKGGENIHRMQAQTGATIQIAKESEMKPGETVRSIWLKGSPSAVAEMKIKVDEIISAKINPGAAQAQASGPKTMMFKDPEYAYVIKLPVPNDKVGIIIGKGGMTVKSIQERTRASILIPTGPDEDNLLVRTLTVGADSKEQAEACQMEIYNVLQAQQQQQAQQANVLASAMHIQVPDDKVGLVIGKGGMTIKDMQSRLRVKIQIPQSADPGTNPPVRTITVVGPPESQHLARYEIELVIAGQGHSIGSANPYAQQTSYGGGGGGGGAWGASAGAYGGIQQQPQQSYYGAPAAGAYGATAGYGGYDANTYYGATAAAYGAVANPYGAMAAAPIVAASSTEVPTDPTAYYNDFWLYCTYYGEAAARVYYGAWSPPEGTPAPANLATAIAAPGATGQVATAGSVAANPTAVAVSGSSSSSVGEGTEGPSTSAAESTTEASSNDDDPVLADPEAQAAWVAYKKQYAEWYEQHGRAAGADPNPPRPQ